MTIMKQTWSAWTAPHTMEVPDRMPKAPLEQPVAEIEI